MCFAWRFQELLVLQVLVRRERRDHRGEPAVCLGNGPLLHVRRSRAEGNRLRGRPPGSYYGAEGAGLQSRLRRVRKDVSENVRQLIVTDPQRKPHPKIAFPRCWTLLDNNAEDVLASDDFVAIDSVLLKKILRRSSLCVYNECSVSEAAQRWAEHRLTRYLFVNIH